MKTSSYIYISIFKYNVLCSCEDIDESLFSLIALTSQK